VLGKETLHPADLMAPPPAALGAARPALLSVAARKPFWRTVAFFGCCKSLNPPPADLLCVPCPRTDRTRRVPCPRTDRTRLSVRGGACRGHGKGGGKQCPGPSNFSVALCLNWLGLAIFHYARSLDPIRGKWKSSTCSVSNHQHRISRFRSTEYTVADWPLSASATRRVRDKRARRACLSALRGAGAFVCCECS